MLLLLPVLTILPALLSLIFAGIFGPDVHLRFGYLASLPSLVGLPPFRIPGFRSSFTEFPGFTHSELLTPLAVTVYCARSFDVIPHPVLFSPYIPAPNLARNISVYQPWLNTLSDVDNIYVPVQFPISETALNFNFVFILSLSTIEFKLWFLAYFLGIIALALCCPYANLFDCDFFPKRRTTLPKKIIPLTPGEPTLNSTYGRPLFTAAFGSYPYPCFLTTPTTPDCLPIRNETVDRFCIHPSPSNLDSCLSSSQSKSCVPADFKALKISHENDVDSVPNKETRLEDCTNGFLPLKETSFDIKPVSPTMDDSDTRNLQVKNIGLISLKERVLEHITVDCSLEPVFNEASVDESNSGTLGATHSKASMAKQKCEESELAFNNTSRNTTETISSFTSAIERNHLEIGHRPSCCMGSKLERQIVNGTAYGVEQTIDDCAVTISSSSPPVLTESSFGQTQTVISQLVDSIINCAEKTSEPGNICECNLPESEVKVKRKRGCRGGVRSSKRIAARRQAAAKKELESLQYASVETFTSERSVIVKTDSLLIDSNTFERDYVEAESNLLVLDSSCYLVAPRESDTPDLPITLDIQSIGAELQVNTPDSSTCGKTFKPSYIKKRGYRGKKKSSKQQLQSSCDNLSPIQVTL